MIKLHVATIMQNMTGQDIDRKQFANIQELIDYVIAALSDTSVISFSYNSRPVSYSNERPEFYFCRGRTSLVNFLLCYDKGMSMPIAFITDIHIYEWETYEDALKWAIDVSETSSVGRNKN